MNSLFAEIHRRNPVLSAVGWFHLSLVVLSMILIVFDSRAIMGDNAWGKPLRINISILVYVWTLAWYSSYTRASHSLVKKISLVIAVALVGEIILIMMQAGRGVQSHFNSATTFDSLVSNTMAVLATVYAIGVTGMMILQFYSKPEISRAFSWSVRAGFISLTIGNIIGGMMIVYGAHTVGAPEGGPGLWFLNWSVDYGDLRVPHLLGLHGLQLLPLLGFAFTKWFERKEIGGATLATCACASIYILLCVGSQIQALNGNPFRLY